MQSFDLFIEPNASLFYSHSEPTDVDGSLGTIPLDALLVINYLNLDLQSRRSASSRPYAPRQSLDVNNDGIISPLDARIIINQLNLINQRSLDLPSTEGEGVMTSSPIAISRIAVDSAILSFDFNSDRKKASHRRVTVTYR